MLYNERRSVAEKEAESARSRERQRMFVKIMKPFRSRSNEATMPIKAPNLFQTNCSQPFNQSSKGDVQVEPTENKESTTSAKPPNLFQIIRSLSFKESSKGHDAQVGQAQGEGDTTVSYTHLRAHETLR